MKALALTLYTAILVAATLLLDSRLLWLLYGPLVVAFLDVRVFRVFIKPDPARSPFMGLIGPTCIAAACFVVGLIVRKFFKIPVPYEEIARLSASGALLWFLFEQLCVAFVRWSRAGAEGNWRNTSKRVGATLAAVGPPAFLLLPLVNLHPPHVSPVDLRKHFPATFTDVTFTAEDGVKLSGWWAEHDHPRGNVLLCHGHGQTRTQMAEILPFLQGRGYNVLAFDFRGHGSSQGMSATFGAREVADMKAAAAFVSDRRPGLPLYIVGFSYGAIVSLQALPELPTVAAIWVDSPCGHFTAIAEKYFDFLPRPLCSAAVAGYDLASWCDCGFKISGINPADAIQRVRTPIHFSHCQGDPLIPYDDTRRMFDAYQGPKVCDFPDVERHGVYFNVDSKDYLQRLADFFAKY